MPFSKSHTLASLTIQRDGAEHFVAGSNAWYEGRNGWLFLGNRYNDTISKLRLADMPSRAEISTVYRQFDEIVSLAQSVGAQVALLIGPNKSSVYPEHLPDEVTPSSRRYVDFFLQQLEDIDGLIVHDPTSDLIAQSKILGNLYWRTDTHWNPLGAFVAYSGLMDELGMESVNVAFRPGGGYRGDLIRISGREDFAVQDDDNWIAVYESEPNWKEVSGAVREDDPFGNRQTVINSNSLVDKYVWVVGDSFVAGQRDYLNSTFSEVDYIGHWSKLLDEIPSKLLRAQRKPDLILIVRVERSF